MSLEVPKLPSQELEPIKISFGDVFITPYEKPIKYVILIPELEGPLFEVAPIVEYKGREALNFIGTASRKDIKEIVDHWSLERVLEAIRVFQDDPDTNHPYYDHFRELAKQEPRILSSE